jgi:cytochrome c peroxidase
MKKSRVLSILVMAMFLFAPVCWGTAWADDLEPMERLGKELFFDNISGPDRQSCAACHAPEVGWTGPVAGINVHGTVYRGAVPTRFGNRKPPSAAYATLSPIFHYDEGEELFIGGNFWDGRATGEDLGNPAADQARGPFLNPVEQNNPSMQAVCEQVAAAKYAVLFEEAFGEPIQCDSEDNIAKNYDRIAFAIATYEDSTEVNQFSSKFDAYLAGQVELSAKEMSGLQLFDGKAKCSACHPIAPGPQGEPPLLTDFTYDNLGVPKNPENPFYRMDTEYLDDGSPINPLGLDWVDPGLAGFLATRTEYADKAVENMGKHKVPTLRNVAKSYGEGFPKAYTHNGYFKSLKAIVHFYNTRDVKDVCENAFTSERDALRMNCWPVAEVQDNVNTEELGNLELTDEEEDAIVAFLETLSDGFDAKNKVK